MQWYTQTDNITTNFNIKVDSTLPKLISTNFIMYNFHGDDSAKGRYDMILGRYLWSEFELNLKWSYHVIKSDYGTFKGSTTPMVDLYMYEFIILNTGKITPEEYFTNSYIEELNKLEQICTATKWLRVILDSK